MQEFYSIERIVVGFKRAMAYWTTANQWGQNPDNRYQKGRLLLFCNLSTSLHKHVDLEEELTCWFPTLLKMYGSIFSLSLSLFIPDSPLSSETAQRSGRSACVHTKSAKHHTTEIQDTYNEKQNQFILPLFCNNRRIHTYMYYTMYIQQLPIENKTDQKY